MFICEYLGFQVSLCPTGILNNARLWLCTDMPCLFYSYLYTHINVDVYRSHPFRLFWDKEVFVNQKQSSWTCLWLHPCQLHWMYHTDKRLSADATGALPSSHQLLSKAGTNADVTAITNKMWLDNGVFGKGQSLLQLNLNLNLSF